jgi:hypothetical protein
MTYDVVWPKSPSGVQRMALAPRLGDLAGKRIAFLWDYLFRGEEIFAALGAELTSRGAQVVNYDEFGNIHGPDERTIVANLPETLARHRIDAVVVGNGC